MLAQDLANELRTTTAAATFRLAQPVEEVTAMSVGTAWEAKWLELLSELFRAPLLEFPVEALADQLRSTLHGTAVSWNFRDEHANAHALLWLPEERTAERTEQEYERYVADGGLARHPLLKWAAVAGSTPQTMSRVPRSISPRSDRDSCLEVMRPLGAQEQLAMPIVIRDLSHATFVVARPEDDFSEGDLAVARLLQPMLVGLASQVHALSAWQGASPSRERWNVAQQLGLTGREIAVLDLLATGLTQMRE